MTISKSNEEIVLQPPSKGMTETKRHNHFKVQFLLFVHSPLIGILKEEIKKQKQTFVLKW